MEKKSTRALSVACPDCGAAAGARCTAELEGGRRVAVCIHFERIQAAGMRRPKSPTERWGYKDKPGRLTKYLPGKRGARKFLRCQGRKADGTQCNHTIHKCRSHENHAKAVAGMCAQVTPEPTM